MPEGAPSPRGVSGADRAGRLWLRVGAATLVLATLLLCAFYLALERRNQLDLAGALAKRRVIALADQLGESLNQADLVIAQHEARLRHAHAADRADDLRWQLDRAAWLASLPLPFALYRVDAAGLAQPLSGVGEPRPAGVVLPTAPQSPADTPGTWHVGLPLGLPGGPVLPLVQRVRSVDADTVALAMHLDLDTLRRRLAQSLEGAAGGAALFRIESDGRVSLLARAPDSPPHVGQPLRTPVSVALAQAPAGRFATETVLDGVHRQVAYQRVGGAQGALVLVSALDTEALLARWRAQLPWVMGLALLLSTAIGLGARRLDRALGALQRERAALARSEAQFRALAADLERRVHERTQQLALSESRYRRIFETVPVAISEEDWSGVQQILRGLRAQGVADLEAHLGQHPGLLRQCMRAVVMTRANPRTRALQARYPLPRNAAQLQGVEIYYPTAALEPLFLAELLALWHSHSQFNAQRHVRDRDGRPLQLLLSAALPTPDDADGAVLVCLVDVTELEQARAELAHHVARLRQVNKELETFTYSVSHDLKAPLRGIDGYSRLLMSDHFHRLDDEGQQFLGHIRRATQHMGVLIDDLLAYSRLERRELTLGPVPLAPLVQAVLANFQSELAQRGVALQVDVPEGLVARADVQGLTMALRNLVDNALKFSRDRPTPALGLHAARVGDVLRLTVADNGVGFDMKYHDRIFSIFQRLHRAEDYPGTGIGLAIVRKAIDRMGGRVWAEGRPGEGADFHLELPLA